MQTKDSDERRQRRVLRGRAALGLQTSSRALPISTNATSKPKKRCTSTQGFRFTSNEVAKIRIRAEQGDSEAQYQMACAHRRGQGVPQSDVEAARYDWKAAEQGHSEAQHNRAVSCTLGRGVTQNQEEGIKWHRKAAESGNVRSQHVLGIACLKGLGVARDIRKAIDYLQKASDKGYAKSQNCLAKIYLHGQPDVPQDVGLALCLFREAADGGDPEACTNIGQLASDGEEAVNWYRLGAEQGDPEAQFLLAQAYLSAHGIGGSHQEALRYLRMAAEQGHCNAQNTLGAIFMNGHGVKRNQEEGERWFRSAASSGNAEACFNLGVIAREDGRRDEAASFFRQASALGLKEAKHELA